MKYSKLSLVASTLVVALAFNGCSNDDNNNTVVPDNNTTVEAEDLSISIIHVND